MTMGYEPAALALQQLTQGLGAINGTLAELLRQSYTRAFKPGPIEPVAHPGDKVLTIDREQYSLYVVGYVEQIPLSHPLVVNIGAIAAGTTAAINNPQNQLDMPYGTFAQYRARVLDDIHVLIYQPQASARFTNKTQVARVNVFSQLEDPCGHQTEVFVFEDQRIFLQATNPTLYALVQARVAFWGYKYVLLGPGGASTGGHVLPFRKWTSITEALESGERFIVVPTGGWGR